MEKEYISVKQCLFLLMGSMMGISLMLAPSVSVLLAKQDAWLVPWLSAVPGLVLIGLLISLNKMYPGQSLVQYSHSILGLFGKFLVLIPIWFFLYLGAQNLREITNFIASIILFETPRLVLYFFTILISVYALKLGLETVARAFSFLVFIAFILLLFIQVYSMLNANYENLLPILGAGVLPVIRASLNFTAAPVGDVIILFSMVIYHVKYPRDLGAKLSIGFIFLMFIMFLVIGRVIVTLGPDRATRNIYSIAATINATTGGGLVLPFMTLNWFLFSLCQFILCYYAFVTSVAHWAKLADYKPLLLPAAPLFIVLGIYSFDNSVEAFAFYQVIWPVYAIFSSFFLPLLLWLVAITKNKVKLNSQQNKKPSVTIPGDENG
ncbi:endospore germination permease [Desulfotomaculum defluvii]